MGNNNSTKSACYQIKYNRDEINRQKNFFSLPNGSIREVFYYKLLNDRGKFDVTLFSIIDGYYVSEFEGKKRLIVRYSEELKNKLNPIYDIFNDNLDNGLSLKIDKNILLTSNDKIKDVECLINKSDSIKIEGEMKFVYKFEKMKMLLIVNKIECYKDGVLLTNDSTMQDELPIVEAYIVV